MLLIVTGFGIVAVASGQAIEFVDFTSGRVGFYSSNRGTVSEQEAKTKQAELEERMSRLESEAQQEEPKGAAPGTVDLSGTWSGSGGFEYVLSQYGNEVLMTEYQGYEVTAAAWGAVTGNRLDFTFEAINGSVGSGSLTLTDQDTLRGTITNTTWGDTAPMELTH